MALFTKNSRVALEGQTQHQRLRRQSGAASVEYAILVALVATIIFTVVSEYDISGAYVSVSAKVKSSL